MEMFLNMVATPGFWRGVTYFLMAAGIKIEPDMENSIIALGLAVSGFIHVVAAKKPK